MDQLSSETAGPADLQEEFDALFRDEKGQLLQQEEHGQLLLLTNERTGSGELETIQNEIDSIVEAFDDHSIIQVRKATRSTLLGAVRRHAEAVVVAHFSGHGHEGFAVHRGPSNNLDVLKPAYLARVFACCRRLRCVVFNACFCAAAADAFMRSCPAVHYIVYFTRRIGDLAAYDFAGGFYAVLREDWDVEHAFSEARTMLATYSARYYDGQLPNIKIRGETEPPVFRVGPPRRPLQFTVLLQKSLSKAEVDEYAADIRESIQRELLERVSLNVSSVDIVVEKWRTRWELRLDTVFEIQTTETQAKAVFERLQERYETPGVKIVLETWRPGSLILCLNSSLDAFQELQAEHAKGGLSPVLGMPVLSLTEIGMEATITAPGYVYTRLCAYETACIERELEPAMRIGLPQRIPAEQRDAGASSSRKRQLVDAAVNQQAQRKQRRPPSESDSAAVEASGAAEGSDSGSAKGRGGMLDGKYDDEDGASTAGVSEATKKALNELEHGATALDLSGQGLGPDDILALAKALEGNTSLATLEVHGNHFGPDGIAALGEALKVNTRLTKLGLGDNDLGFGDLTALAEALKVNKALTTLNVIDSNLGPGDVTALAEALKANKALTTLNVIDNYLGFGDLTALAEALKVNKALTTLNVIGSSFGDGGIAVLAEALKVNKTLATLNVGWNGVGSNGIIALAGALKVNTSLATLSLRGNKLGDCGIAVLAEALKVNKTLATLDVGCNPFGQRGIAALAEALKVNLTLTTLNLEDSDHTSSHEEIRAYLERNAAGHSEPYSSAGVSEATKKALNELDHGATTLNLSGNHFGPDGIAAVAEALKVNTRLTKLVLGDNNLRFGDLTALAEALKVNKTLTTLDVGGSSFGDGGIAVLAEALKFNKTLTTLDVGGSSFGDGGIAVLAEALKFNKTLTTLDVGGSSFWGGGIAVLAEALKVNKALTTLDVGNNNLGQHHFAVLAEALKANTSLTTLKAQFNNCGPGGLAALAEALKVNKSLITLDIRSNNLGPGDGIVLASALKVNQSLATLDILGNEFGRDDGDALWEALMVNRTLTTLNVARARGCVCARTA